MVYKSSTFLFKCRGKFVEIEFGCGVSCLVKLIDVGLGCIVKVDECMFAYVCEYC